MFSKKSVSSWEIMFLNIDYLLSNMLVQFRICLIFIIMLGIINSGASQGKKLRVIATSDVHGTYLPVSFIDKKVFGNSLAHVQTYLKAEKAIEDQEILLLDNGDFLQGDPMVYYYNYEKTEGTHISASVMNYMGYDAASVGNHDIEAGHENYDKLVRQFRFPWLAANAIRENNSEPYFEPFTIIHRAGLKIAILGLITPAVPTWLPRYLYEGMYFEDMIESADKWVKHIRNQEKPDLLICLSHAGIDYKYNNQNAFTYKNENPSLLIAMKVPGIDLMIAGHDHRGCDSMVTNSEGKRVPVLAPTSNARDIVTAVFEFSNPTGNSATYKVSTEVVEMKNFRPDEEFIEQFRPQFEEVTKYVARPIGVMAQSISARESLFGDSPFLDLIHQLQLKITSADISFAAPLMLDAYIDSGTLFILDMFKLYKYENLIYVLELTGLEILDYLEYSYSLWFNDMKSENDHLLKFKTDNAGNLLVTRANGAVDLANQFFNFDTAEGIDYEIDLRAKPGEKVSIRRFTDGRVFELDKKYKVAINSYRASGGGGHLTAGAKIPRDEVDKRIVFTSRKDLRYLMIEWIETQKTIVPAVNSNWRVIPYSWWFGGKIRDYPLVFGLQSK